MADKELAERALLIRDIKEAMANMIIALPKRMTTGDPGEKANEAFNYLQTHITVLEATEYSDTDGLIVAIKEMTSDLKKYKSDHQKIIASSAEYQLIVKEFENAINALFSHLSGQ